MSLSNLIQQMSQCVQGISNHAGQNRCARRRGRRSLRLEGLEQRQLMAIGAAGMGPLEMPAAQDVVDVEQVAQAQPDVATAASIELLDDGPVEITFNDFIPGLEPRPGYHTVRGIALSPDESQLYAAQWTTSPAGGEPIAIYSTTDHSYLDKVAYGACHGDVVASPNGRYLYTSNYYGGSVTRFDLANGDMTHLDAGRWAADLALSPDGKTLVVGSGMEGQNGGITDEVYFYDVEGDRFELITSVTLQSEIYRGYFTFSDDSESVFVGTRERNAEKGEVYELSVDTPHVRNSVAIPGGNAALAGIVIDGDRLLVADTEQSKLWEIDRSTFTVTGSIDMAEAPGAMKVHPDGRHLFILHPDADSLSVLDLNTDTVVDGFTSADSEQNPFDLPYDIEFTADGTRAYIAHYSNPDGGVTVLDLEIEPVSVTLALNSSKGSFMLAPGEEIEVTAQVAESPQNLIGFQLAFGGSDAATGELGLNDWNTGDDWGMLFDQSLASPEDYFVAAAAFPGVANPGLLGTFRLTAPDESGEYLLSLDDGMNGPFSTAFVTTEGTVAIADYGSVTVLVDGSAPEGDLVSPGPDSATNQVPGHLDVQWTDPGSTVSGLDPTTFDVNDVQILSGGVPLSIDHIEDLGDGRCRYYYGTDGETLTEGSVSVTLVAGEVADLVGNTNEGRSETFLYDATSPEGDLRTPLPDSLAIQDLGYVEISWTDPGNEASGVDPASIDAADIVLRTEAGNLTVDRIEDLGNGTYRYHYADDGETLVDGTVTVSLVAGEVVDLAGNESAAAEFSFRYDGSSPEVISLAINEGLPEPSEKPGEAAPTDWTTQRSDLRTIVVTFSEEVHVTTSDLQLTNLGINAPEDADFVVPIQDEYVTISGNTITIEFPPMELPDGVYQLVISPNVADAAGNQLDGNGDGIGGDAFVQAGDATNAFFKLKGDFNGDGGVSMLDMPGLLYWFGQAVPQAPSFADLNSDGAVSIRDYAEFIDCLNASITFPDDSVIYTTDFATDPGWITNNAARLYWDSAAETYHASQENVNGGGDYAYQEVDYQGQSFQLQWDMLPTAVDYAADTDFGLFDSTNITGDTGGQFIKAGFHTEDRGRTFSISWGRGDQVEAVYSTSPQWSPGTWYTLVLTYDAEAATLHGEITERATGAPVASMDLSDVEPFDADMNRLGSSGVRLNGSYQAPGAEWFGEIDNVSLTSLSGDPHDPPVYILPIVPILPEPILPEPIVPILPEPVFRSDEQIRPIDRSLPESADPEEMPADHVHVTVDEALESSPYVDDYSGYFVKNTFERDASESFVVLTSQEQFDEVFGVIGCCWDVHRLDDSAFDTQIVLAVINRGDAAAWDYGVESVSIQDGELQLRYNSTSRYSSFGTACKLIVSVPKDEYASVVFIENGEAVRTVEMPQHNDEDDTVLPGMAADWSSRDRATTDGKKEGDCDHGITADHEHMPEQAADRIRDSRADASVEATDLVLSQGTDDLLASLYWLDSNATDRSSAKLKADKVNDRALMMMME